jgi:hypothetical protein
MAISFDRFAGACAILAGVGGLLYSAAFLFLLYSDSPRTAAKLNDVFLMAGGFLSVIVFVALYGRLRDTEPGFALLATVFGIAAGLGSLIHGAYRAANFIKPPGRGIGDMLPNPVNPRGLLTFAMTSLALALVAWLILAGGRLPRGLGYLSGLAGVLFMVVYLDRLIILNPKNPFLLAVALLTGFVVSPALYVWLGRVLWRYPAV